MPELGIKFLRVGDPPLREIADAVEVQLEEVVVIERGMESGLPSVSFLFRLPDGDVCVAQTSGRLVDALAGGVRGLVPRGMTL